MFEQDMQGFMVRSRSKGYQEQEIGSLYSVGREVKQGKVSNLGSLLINGIEVQDKKVLEEEVSCFFETLFQGRHRSVPGNLILWIVEYVSSQIGQIWKNS